MNFTNNPRSVRVDFFRPSGRWYETEAVVVSDESFNDPNLWDVLRTALPLREDGTYRYGGMTAICLEPYSKFAHPISLVVPEGKP